MNELVIPSLYMLAGVVLYATAHHFAAAIRPPHDRIHLYFGAMCLMVVLFALYLVQYLKATNIIELAHGLKWNIAAILLFFILFPWFIALYSGKGPRSFLIGLSVLFAMLFVVNLTQPYSLQYDHIDGLHMQQLPWGETVTRADGHIGPWFYIGITGVIVTFSYALYAFSGVYYRNRRGTDLWMLLAIVLFFLGGLEAILVRLSAINFIELGPFSIIAMVLVMGTALTREMQERLRESETRFRTVIAQSPIAIGFARDGITVGGNAGYLQMFGYHDMEELRGKPLNDQIAPQCRAEIEDRLRRRVQGDPTETTYETIGLRKDGSQFPLLISAKRVVFKNGPLTFAFMIDLSERKQAEAELRIAATAFESQESLMITDTEGVILRVNKAFTESTGYTAGEIVGQTPRLLKSGRHDPEFYRKMWDTLHRTGAWQGEIWDRRKNGEIYPKWLSISAVKGDDGVVTHYVGSHIDITERKATEEKILHLAFYDHLTNLPNRLLLMDRLKQALASSARSNHRGSLLFIDLDNFKNLNDTLGHDMGDMLLKQVTQRLGSCIREGDTVARLGGDEFMVMLVDLSAQPMDAAAETEAVGEKILAALNQPFQLGSYVHRCTASVGATLFSDHQQATDELMKQADIAMYQAKKAGRNTLRFFDPKMQENISARVTLEDELRRAIERQQFQLHYQIQVDRDLRPFGAEALIRWLHPERGTISPVQFIPLAEETGLILPIGLWVLETACAQIRAWGQDARTRELTLAVNVSARQFRQADFVAQVRAAVQRHAIKPRLLKLELTESLLQENIEETIAIMNALSDTGVQFSLDDFGTGYSSLQYLKRLPLDQLKIDQSFVRDLASNSSDIAVVRATIAMARSLELDVIAEGVETEEQRHLLLKNGCTYYQGYLFGRPVPIEQFEASLRQG